jgi:hypothetical protein
MATAGKMTKSLPYSYFYRLSTEINNIKSQNIIGQVVFGETVTNCVLSDAI